MKDKIKNNFSKAAKSYDKNAVVQLKIIKRLIKKLPKKSYLNILEIGCGTGNLTEILAENFKEGKITAVDISEGMIKIAKEKVNSERVNFIVSDIEELIIKEKYDLIISTSTFQWIENLEGLFLKLNNNLNKAGVLAFSTFLEGTFKELDNSINIVLEKNNIGVRQNRNYLTFEKLNEIIENNFQGNKKNFIKNQYNEYFHSSLEFLKSVKGIGANSSELQRYITPKITKEIITSYDKLYREDDFIVVTYEVFIGIIVKE